MADFRPGNYIGRKVEVTKQFEDLHGRVFEAGTQGTIDRSERGGAFATVSMDDGRSVVVAGAEIRLID